MRSEGINSRKLFEAINGTVLIIMSVIMLYPFVYTLSMSFSDMVSASKGGLHLYPERISLTAYRMVFANRSILIGYGNTLYRTVLGTLLTLLFTSMTAYPLSRKYMPHRNFYMLYVLFTMLFHGGLIPTYLVMNAIHLVDNRLIYLLGGLISGFNVVIFKNFFQSIPDSLIESAKIDGAPEYKILFRIILPLSAPVLATVALWVAVGHWNAWFDALIYINSDSKRVLQTFLQRVVIQDYTKLIETGIETPDTFSFTPESIKSATIIVTILPILFLYPFIQKYFTKGIMIGAVKG